jgi:hypothetical protein
LRLPVQPIAPRGTFPNLSHVTFPHKRDMANEEQRKAFAAYMGRSNASTASAGQALPQYPGSVAQPGNQHEPGNQHLYNVYVWALRRHCLSSAGD